MEDSILSFGANVILAPILIWFMKQNGELIKKLMGQQERTSAVISENSEVMRENKDAMHRTADAVDNMNRVIVSCTKK